MFESYFNIIEFFLAFFLFHWVFLEFDGLLVNLSFQEWDVVHKFLLCVVLFLNFFLNIINFFSFNFCSSFYLRIFFKLNFWLFGLTAIFWFFAGNFCLVSNTFSSLERFFRSLINLKNIHVFFCQWFFRISQYRNNIWDNRLRRAWSLLTNLLKCLLYLFLEFIEFFFYVGNLLKH